jgi:hypothetical protein
LWTAVFGRRGRPGERDSSISHHQGAYSLSYSGYVMLVLLSTTKLQPSQAPFGSREFQRNFIGITGWRKGTQCVCLEHRKGKFLIFGIL